MEDVFAVILVSLVPLSMLAYLIHKREFKFVIINVAILAVYAGGLGIAIENARGFEGFGIFGLLLLLFAIHFVVILIRIVRVAMWGKAPPVPIPPPTPPRAPVDPFTGSATFNDEDPFD